MGAENVVRWGWRDGLENRASVLHGTTACNSSTRESTPLASLGIYTHVYTQERKKKKESKCTILIQLIVT